MPVMNSLNVAVMNVLAILASLIAATSSPPLPGALCSKFPFPGGRSERDLHFIGAVTPDTVFAGPGKVNYIVAHGHFSPAGTRSIYGQVVNVERLGASAAALLGTDVTRAVLVPWDYAADCTPTPWTSTSMWLDPGTRGLFMVTLRDSSHWVKGVPTFDVFTPEMVPYPQRAMMRGRRVSADSMLSLEDAFALLDVLPEQRLLRDSAEKTTAPLLAWARANPQLAKRYPASDVLIRARYTVQQSLMRRIQSPLAGTYHFTITAANGQEKSFYARTRAVPTSPWTHRSQTAPPADPTSIPELDGYYLLASGALSADALPGTCDRDRNMEREGYIAVLHQAPVQTAVGRQWSGKVEFDLITRVFPGDVELKQLAQDDFRRFGERRRAALPFELPARFTEARDGSLQVEQTITFNDGRKFTIRGARVSKVTIACKL
jgi:hypothetical protein